MANQVLLLLLLLAIFATLSTAFFSFKPPAGKGPSKPSAPAKAAASKGPANKGRPDPAPEAYVPEKKDDFLTASWRYNRKK